MTFEPRSPCQASSRAVYCKPTIAQMLAATRSLYQDELRPFGRILLKRIRERMARAAVEAAGLPPPAVPDVTTVPFIDPRCLRRLCEGCAVFQVLPAEGKEYAVTLAGHTGVFVDPCSPRDPYPGRMWCEAAAYFEGLSIEEGKLPSGRYACAQVVKARELPFFCGKSLGEVCHIIQLCISQKKILGYSDSHLVPYGRSDECVKEHCALRQQPVSSPFEARVPYATWEDVREGIRVVLETSTNPGPGMITLSNVKRLFRAQLRLELSETVLGHSRVGELLQDARLHDICALHAVGNGQAVVHLVGAAAGGWVPYSGMVLPSQQAYFLPQHSAAPYDGAVAATFEGGAEGLSGWGSAATASSAHGWGSAAAASPVHGGEDGARCMTWSSCASNRQPVASAPLAVPASAEEAGAWDRAGAATEAWVPVYMLPAGEVTFEAEAQAAPYEPAGEGGKMDMTCSTTQDIQGDVDELDTRSVHSWSTNASVATIKEAAIEELLGHGLSAASRSGLVVRNTFLDVSPQARRAQGGRRASSAGRAAR